MSSAAAARIAPLTLTSAAIKQIKSILQSKPTFVGLRIGVQQKGCSGLSYCLEYATEKKPSDIEIIEDGVTIFMDRKAQLTLIGSEMDYKKDKLSSEFTFNNPNVTGTCGCGESFTIKNQP